MELYELKQGVDTHLTKLISLGESLDLTSKRHKIEELTSLTLEETFWNDANNAQNILKQLNAMKDIVDLYDELNKILLSLQEMNAFLKDDYDEEMFGLAQEEYETMEKTFSDFEIKMLLSHEYDHSNVIMELHSGAGGTESCDWVDMLYRMYSRYAANKGYKVSVLDYLAGEEVGIKSVTMLIEGDMAYGFLKAEKGVHRLVRISPFDSGGRRHTTFASVDVLPQFNNEIEIELKSEDLEVDTHRASGAGGQHVNKTDSAVRIVHKPTGLVATCQSGRSQHDNREAAMNMLKSRIYQKMIEEQEAKIKAFKGEMKAIEWGSQIRSYVFHPYSMVKDHRTNYETSDTQGVMDGELDGFIYAWLKAQIVH
ncbi:MAG: peptide chain release factor 2 [Erysipelotrichaceae bacterium]